MFDDWESYQAEWAGEYDGTTCPMCGRLRMLICNNAKLRCEKCNWDPDANEYSEYSEHGPS